MKRFILILLFFFFFFFYIKSNNGIFFTHIGIDEGLPQINVLSIYQDEVGTMWFGTIEGLCRYNGKTTQIFNSSTNDKELTQNIIYSITGNKKGALYIQANYDLIRYDIEKEEFGSLVQGGVRSLYYYKDMLWYATNDAIYRYDEKEDKIFRYTSLNPDIGIISSIRVSDNGTIWIGSDKGLTIIYATDLSSQKILNDIHVTTLYIDGKQNIWSGTHRDGIYLIDKNGQILSQFKHINDKPSISNNQIRTIIEDDNGIFWIGTFFGLNSYDPVSQRWGNYIHVDNQPFTLSHSSVFSLYKDTQGTMWVGTYFGGVNYFNPGKNTFNFYGASSSDPNYLSFPFIGKMAEDKNGNLWICTEGGGLNHMNLQTRKISRYMYAGYDYETIDQYNQKCIWYNEAMDRLYIGIHNGGLSIFDIKTKTFRILKHNPDDINSLPNNTINDMQYYNGYLILLTATGLIKMDIEKEKFYPFSEVPEIQKALRLCQTSSFFIDSKSRLWISSFDGLLCIYLKENRVKKYLHDENNPASIGRFRADDIIETKDGQIYLATAGSGLFLYDPETDGFINYTAKENGLISDYCYSITEISSGNLILLFNKGFSYFNPEYPDKTISYPSSDIPLSGFFIGSSAYVTKNGEIFVGGINGLMSFYESQLNAPSEKYDLYFDRLYINNKPVYPGDDSNILDKILSHYKEINLENDQNNISIEFASSNYAQKTARNYEYILYNFDKAWSVSASDNIITYTNINPGNYKLVIKEIDSGKSIELGINIKPPFYASMLAYMLYVVLFVFIIIYAVKLLLWRSRLRAEVALERAEKERGEKLNQAKFQFFTNVSHELRTPLTMIIGQTETLLQSSELSTKIYNKILKIHKNASHMRNLISELLDFRKQEQGYYKLRAEQIELNKYIKEVFESFIELASKRRIKYKYESSGENIFVYLDPKQFHKAIYNLLSNAFKYTAANGAITVRLLQMSGKVLIQVEDNGIGIPQDSLSKIFERFYQIEYRSMGLSLGTGIGLALCKEIVEAHHGTIKVESTIDEGSLFEISLLKGYSHFTENELINIKEVSIIDNDSQNGISAILERYENEYLTFQQQDEPENKEETDKPVILIVDDYDDIQEMLTEIFSPYYIVHTASNGKEGLNIALDILPDLILSDVMMPEMSGKEMCYKIKNNVNLSHIPVVLLTSQASQEQTIEGYIFGADDYITKPFSVELLLSRCNNLIRNRKLIYQKMRQHIDATVKFSMASEHDQKLIDKVTQIIKDNFNNLEFDMDVLASQLGFGRNKLYSTIKEITGLTPNDYTMSIKLKEAAYLLDNHKYMNVSEIAFSLGFSSLKYFTKRFKEFYGIPPQQWKKRKQNNQAC